MKLSEVSLSTKNVEQINNIKKAPVILNQRMTKPVSDSFVNTSISKKEEKQNFLQNTHPHGAFFKKNCLLCE